jgi:3-hydroxyisobutyrate dehydrogenase-like beta-hydroxyacid dehydrogenase
MTEELAAGLAPDGVTLVGAPVSGGPSGAETGTLSVMVGGPSATVARLNELCEILGSDRVHTDRQPGSGHAMKLLNNYLSFVAMIATSEVVALGEQVGLETETMLEVFNTSSGRNTATSFKYPEYVLPGSYDMEYTMGLVEKDMQLLMDVAAETGTPFHSGGTIRQLIGAIRAELGADADYTEIHRYFQELMADSAG